jgi:predicted RNA polymerase sigma factor
VNFQKIVVATDFSPASTAALERAAAMAKSAGAELHVIHVVEVIRGLKKYYKYFSDRGSTPCIGGAENGARNGANMPNPKRSCQNTTYRSC